MTLHWSIWRDKGTEPWVVEVLRMGYRVLFVTISPPLVSSGCSSELFSQLHRKGSSLRRGFGTSNKGDSRACSPLLGVIQSPICCLEGFGFVEACDRPLPSEQVCPLNSFQDGYQPIGTSVHMEVG